MPTSDLFPSYHQARDLRKVAVVQERLDSGADGTASRGRGITSKKGVPALALRVPLETVGDGGPLMVGIIKLAEVF